MQKRSTKEARNTPDKSYGGTKQINPRKESGFSKNLEPVTSNPFLSSGTVDNITPPENRGAGRGLPHSDQGAVGGASFVPDQGAVGGASFVPDQGAVGFTPFDPDQGAFRSIDRLSGKKLAESIFRKSVRDMQRSFTRIEANWKLIPISDENTASNQLDQKESTPRNLSGEEASPRKQDQSPIKRDQPVKSPRKTLQASSDQIPIKRDEPVKSPHKILPASSDQIPVKREQPVKSPRRTLPARPDQLPFTATLGGKDPRRIPVSALPGLQDPRQRRIPPISGETLAQRPLPALPVQTLAQRPLPAIPVQTLAQRPLPALPDQTLAQRPLPAIPGQRPLPAIPGQTLAQRPLPDIPVLTPTLNQSFSRGTGARPKVRVNESDNTVNLANPSADIFESSTKVEHAVLGQKEESTLKNSTGQNVLPEISDQHPDQIKLLETVFPDPPSFLKHCPYCWACSRCIPDHESPLPAEPNPDSEISAMVRYRFPELFTEGNPVQDVFGIADRSPYILLHSFDRLLMAWDLLHKLRCMNSDISIDYYKLFKDILVDEVKFLYSKGYVDKLFLKGDVNNYVELFAANFECYAGLYEAAVVFAYTTLAYIQTLLEGRKHAAQKLQWSEFRMENEKRLGRKATFEEELALDDCLSQRKHLINTDLQQLERVEEELKICITMLSSLVELARLSEKEADDSQ